MQTTNDLLEPDTSTVKLKHLPWTDLQKAVLRGYLKKKAKGEPAETLAELADKVGRTKGHTSAMLNYLKKQDAAKVSNTAVSKKGKLVKKAVAKKAAIKPKKVNKPAPWSDAEEAFLIAQLKNRTLTLPKLTKELKKKFGRKVKNVSVKMAELKKKLDAGTYVKPSQKGKSQPVVQQPKKVKAAKGTTFSVNTNKEGKTTSLSFTGTLRLEQLEGNQVRVIVDLVS